MGSDCSKPGEEEEVDSELIFVTNKQDGYPILCRVWKPPPRRSIGDVRGIVFFIHGGMFSKGDLNSHCQVSKTMALQLGLIVITANFRDGSTTTYSSGKTMEDLKTIVRYFRRSLQQQQQQQNTHNLPFGVVGSSSGGWFALALGNELEKGEIDFLIPLCPVSDCYERAVYLQYCMQQQRQQQQQSKEAADHQYQYHVRHEPDRAKTIFENQLQFFTTMDYMQQATDAVKVNRNNIPTLLIVGAADKNVPPNVTQHIQNSWATRTISIGDAGHEIQNVFPITDPVKNFVPDIERFLKTITTMKKDSSTSTSTTSSEQRRISPALLLVILLLSIVLVSSLCWLVVNLLNDSSALEDPKKKKNLSSMEFYPPPGWESYYGFTMVTQPLRFTIEFIKMILLGGARNRSTLTTAANAFVRT